MIRRAAFALALVIPIAAFAQTAANLPAGPTKIEVTARPIASFAPREPQRVRFGPLTYRGGMTLTSSHPDFGGISALRVEDNGANFLAVTDKGRWLRGQITYEGTRPIGVADAEIAPVLGADGRPLASRGWYDAEAMAVDRGTVWLALERVNRIVAFNVGRDGLLARGMPIAVPPGMARLPHNKGVECLVVVPRTMPLGGALIAISERGLDKENNIRGFLLDGPTPGEFAVKRIGDFDVTDCDVTPGGDLLILERSFSRLQGVGMRIRRLPLKAITPGTTVDGSVLVEADMSFQIDNMEAMSVHRAPDGALVVTLMSDDNFSLFQRTLLLQFTLAERSP